MINAREWLDKEYPKNEVCWRKTLDHYNDQGLNNEIKKREEVIKLNIKEQKLEGNLDLSDFINLEELDCSDNLLTNLILSNNSTSLKKLNLENNNFSLQDLSFLASATNLEELNLGNFGKSLNWDEEETDQGNKFIGSLDCLSKMEKLKQLSIDNTDFDEVDLIKLPVSLEKISYQGAKIAYQLQEYEWRNVYSSSYENDQKEKNFCLSDRRKWEKEGFNKEQTREWIKAGFESKDYQFVSYLRDIEKFIPQKWILSNNYSYEELKNKVNYFGWCRNCRQLNTSENWCQFCVEEEWKKDLEKLTGRELVEKFIQQQPKKVDEYNKENKLKWIPYEQFINIEYLAEGGFSKVYKAKWERERTWYEEIRLENDYIVLKVLKNSQIITTDFLQEIVNYKLVDEIINYISKHIVRCYGVSQDPNTKNYVIVMEYMEGGNLRQCLLKKSKELNLKRRIENLHNIASGLDLIHQQGLIHRDFHMGNILCDNDKIFKKFSCHITDLGLSQPADYQKEEGKVFGVLPYIAPEVLQNKPYTQASDIYSFGIVAYELLTNAYPYPKLDDLSLSLVVCQGYRPSLNEVKIPQELKDLIQNCWDGDSKKRPTAEEVDFSFNKVLVYDEELISQPQEAETKYDSYQIHPTTILTSKLINTKQITQKLTEFSQSVELNLGEQEEKLKTQKQSEIELLESMKINGDTMKFSQLVFNTTELNQVNWEEIAEEQPNWTNVHPNFTPELIQSWQSHSFSPAQTHDWLNIGLQPTDHSFATFLRDQKHLTPEEVLNQGNYEQLSQEFFTYWQEQQARIEITPKGDL